MAPFAPFEPQPRLAVAVSGGRDSMALALLAAEWAARRDGTVLALTVDHGLRPESATEATEVGCRLARCGIAHRVLRYDGPRPRSAIQAAARGIRYHLLDRACRAEGILHLLLAHHREDQAETIAIRGERASGRDGLAGMSPRRETAGPRLLRPLLGLARHRLTATLVTRGQRWVDDPSNADPRFRRAVLRREGLDCERILAGWSGLAADRAAAERVTAAAAADALWVGPEGYVLIDPVVLERQPIDIGRRLVDAVVRCVGTGDGHGPRGAAVERLAGTLRQAGTRRRPAAATLGGCRILSWRGRILVCREPAAAQDEVALSDPGSMAGMVLWDGRFMVAPSAAVPPSWRVRALGRHRPEGARLGDVPGAVRPTLPAIWCGDELLALPTAGWRVRAEVPQVEAWFAPARALAAGPYAVV